jgi:hypothetical protein
VTLLGKKTGQRRYQIRGEEGKWREFRKVFELFRSATNSREVKRLGDKLGRIIFG